MGVNKTKGNQIGFWALDMIAVKALRGRGGQDTLKTSDFQTQEMRVSSKMPSLSVRHLSFGIHIRAERRLAAKFLFFLNFYLELAVHAEQ